MPISSALPQRSPHSAALVSQLAWTVLVTSLLLPTAAGAQRESGIQLTPDSARYLISKNVGPDRWAITYNLGDGSVTGNVFSTTGDAPRFVRCVRVSVDQAPDPADAQYNLSCEFTGPCDAAPCSAAAWSGNPPIPVTVPGSFLLPSGTQATLAGNVQPIFTATCANSDACHADNRPPDLLPGRTWAATFDVPSVQVPEKPFVAPFDGDGSYLLDKILGIQASGARMPLGATPLDAAQTEAVRAWIREGAANN